MGRRRERGDRTAGRGREERAEGQGELWEGVVFIESVSTRQTNTCCSCCEGQTYCLHLGVRKWPSDKLTLF